MAKKKKKLSYSEQQKQMQLQQAQYRNLFLQKIHAVCVAIGDPKLFDLLPPFEQGFIYMMRAAPLSVKAEKGAKIQKRLIEVIESVIKRTVNENRMELIPGSGRTVTLTDYFFAAYTLECCLATTNHKIKERERFDEFMEHSDTRLDFYIETVCKICESICALYNNVAAHKSLYAFQFDIQHKDEKQLDQVKTINSLLTSPSSRSVGLQMWRNMDVRLHPTISIYTIPLETKQVRIDNEPRTAVRLATVHYNENYEPEMFDFFIKSNVLGTEDTFSEDELPVYMQQHAFNRLIERTGYLIPSFAYLQISMCLLQPIVTRLGGNKFLVNFTIKDCKVGYLLCERISNLVLIRTFLFLTNTNTPEGDKLAALTKLQKEDCTYLSIDNLRSLLSSDVMENESLRKLFCEAGCQSLLDLHESLKTDAETQASLGISQQKTALSDIILEYLNPQADNEEYVIGE
jgi:hypothetical protein